MSRAPAIRRSRAPFLLAPAVWPALSILFIACVPPAARAVADNVVVVAENVAENVPPKEAEKSEPKLSPKLEAKLAEFSRKLAAAKRKVWSVRMKKEVEEIQKATSLSAEGVKALEAASEQALDRSTEDCPAKIDSEFRTEANQVDAAQLLTQLDQVLLQVDVIATMPDYDGEVDPWDQPNWAEALHHILNADQAAVWDKVLAERKEAVAKETADMVNATKERMRDQLERGIAVKVGDLEEALAPYPKERTDQLEALAKNAVGQALEQWQKRAQTFLVSMNPEQRRQMLRQGGIYMGSEKGELAEDQSIWKEGLQKLLSDDEQKRLRNTREEHKQRRIQIMAKVMITILDEQIAFTARQRQQLGPIAERLVRDQAALFPEAQPNNYTNYPLGAFFAAGLKAAPAELEPILDAVQRQHWQKACAAQAAGADSDDESALNDSGAVKANAPTGAPEPEDVERSVSALLQTLAAPQRMGILSAMMLKAEDAARVAHLGPEENGRLQTAARGAAERSLQEWKNSTTQIVRSRLADATPIDINQLIKQRVASLQQQYDFNGNRNRAAEPFVWEKTVQTEMTEAQRAAWKNEVDLRQEYSEKAIAAVVVGELDRVSSLKTDQRAKLEPLIAKIVHEYTPDIRNYFSFGRNQTPWYLQYFSKLIPIAGIPEKDLKAILSKKQWERWSGSNEFRNSTMYWSNLQQNHEQRLKTKPPAAGAVKPPSSLAKNAPPSLHSPPTLRWENGESLAGELVEASDSYLTWKSPLFQDPLVLRWPAVRRVDQALAPVPSNDPFAITLRDGSHLHGNLTAIDADSISIQSSRHGEAVLARSAVLSICRVHGGNLLAAGPDGDVGWTADTGFFGIPFATLAPRGALSLPYWNTGASLETPLPELVDLELHFHSSARPDFQIAALAGEDPTLTVETWGDDLVLTAGDAFKLIRKIDAAERDLGFRLCWSQKERKCSVFSPAGDLLTEWQLPDGSKDSAKTLALLNKGGDLSLEFLRLRAWDGRPPAKTRGPRPRLELAGGAILEGQVRVGSTDSITVRPEGNETDLDLPLADIDAIVFSADPSQAAAHDATFSYADGTILMGRIAWIKDGRAALTTSFATEPVISKLGALRQLRLERAPPPEPAPAQRFAGLDQLAFGETTLHGALVCQGGASPRWRPIGSERTVTPSPRKPYEISRALPPDAKISAAPALFYTTAGDVLPGNLLALDRSGAELDSSIVETTKLPAANLDAIQLGAGVQSKVSGFDDPAWRILKGTKETVRRTGDSLAMNPDTSFGHPAVMQCSEISFKMPSSGFSFARLKLFCAGTDGRRSMNLILGSQGNRFISALESAEGQIDFENQSQTPVPANQPVEIRLVIEEKQVQLHLNGSLTMSFPIDSAKRAGVGLIIEPGSMWSNMTQPISLSEFSATTPPGVVWAPDVRAEVKTEALTVPRSQREAPPRHALLAANGDVLRGEVEAVTRTHFGFLSGLETLHIPRDRVKAVLWLKKPLAGPSPSAEDQPAQKILQQKIELRRRMNNASFTSLIAILQEEAVNLKFKLPEKPPARKFQMQFTGQTIGEALEKICSMAGLRYRVDETGAIVVEAASKAKDFVQNVYWLKSTGFPATPAARDLLIAKGIPFPLGGAAAWQPEARQLIVTNTAENQSKLSKLLETEFGGLAGAPTHWLLLSNGARLALTVDEFAEDSISGRHPLYGRCHIPLSEVYTIRSSMPKATAAMHSLGNWRLVSAPEPDIPDAGADAPPAPDLGKDAKPFKLTLLGGGDFDLAKERGKVVVLDFWATWCGPCVRSLPGLITAISAFPADQVELIGVNQGEPEEEVKRFLESRGWKLKVALDTSQRAGRQYGVDGIPHTVIIAPDGKIAWVKTGYSPDGETEAADAIKKLLGPASPESAKPLAP